MERHTEYGSAAGWFVIGGVAGACAALLFAPATGKRTRERLARGLRDAKESVTEFTDDLADSGRQIVEKAERIGDKTARLADDASAAVREVVSSLGSQTKNLVKRS